MELGYLLKQSIISIAIPLMHPQNESMDVVAPTRMAEADGWEREEARGIPEKWLIISAFIEC